MELAGFMADRGWRWHDVKDWRRCVEAWAWASSLVPENELIRNSLKKMMDEWDREQRLRKPVGFPKLWIRCRRSRWFPDSLPLELEQDIFGLLAVENMLSDPRLEGKYWSKMRRGDYSRMPAEALVTFNRLGACCIDLKFI